MKKQLILLLLTFYTCSSVDNAHFYRAIYFSEEPRLIKPWMTTINTYLGGGKTKKSRNQNGDKTKLLNLYGPHNMQQLGTGIDLDPANPLDKILIDLRSLPERSTFGQLLFRGCFRVIEAQVMAYQNFINGFFLQAHIPIRKLEIKNIRFIDLSPTDNAMPNQQNPAWQDFLHNFDAILARHDISLQPTDELGFGDLSMLGGWGLNYQNAIHFDYIDLDARIGFLFPTAKKKNIKKPFDLPLGYNGHYAFDLQWNFAIGLLEWLTIGTHLSALYFLKKTEKLRVKTAEKQNGFIKLARDAIEIDPGSIIDSTTYLKADHVMRGFSLYVGYAYTNKDAACLDPQQESSLDKHVINTDQLFRGWSMHTLHLGAEYDFAHCPADYGPRIGLFYNHIVGGKRIFNTNTFNDYIGIDVAWRY